jgi:hypothetical protein
LIHHQTSGSLLSTWEHGWIDSFCANMLGIDPRELGKWISHSRPLAVHYLSV